MHRLVIALVTLIGLVGALVVAGYLILFSTATDRAAAMVPANTAVYVNVYLQPSTGQQMNLAELIGRLPGFADDASLDEKVDQVVQNLLSGSGIDYRADVKPWLGDQVAIAAWPAGDDATQFEAVLLAEVSDREAAEASVADVVGRGGASFAAQTYEGVELQVSQGAAYAFVGEMLVIGAAPEDLQAVVDVEGGGGSLGDRADFRAAIDRLPEDHLASIFIDLAGIAAAGGATDAAEGLTTASAVLVAEPSGLRLSGSAPVADAPPTASGPADVPAGVDEASTLADWMPPDTIAEAVIFDLRRLFEEAEDAIGSAPGGEEFGSALSTIRAIAAFGLGIDLDVDVLPLLDGEVGIALGGLAEGGLPSGQLLLRPTDAGSAQALLDGLAERLTAAGATMATETAGGTEIVTLELPDTGRASYAVLEGVVILGMGPEDVRAALDAHAAGETLGASTSYADGFEAAGTRAGNEVWVDVGALVEALGAGLTLPEDGRDILSRIGTFALTIPSRDDQIEFHAALTVEAPGAE
jgi:hypothetical protein